MNGLIENASLLVLMISLLVFRPPEVFQQSPAKTPKTATGTERFDPMDLITATELLDKGSLCRCVVSPKRHVADVNINGCMLGFIKSVPCEIVISNTKSDVGEQAYIQTTMR